MDEADFLQELPTEEGKRFITRGDAPSTASALANAWKSSKLNEQLMSEMQYRSIEEAKSLEHANSKLWYTDQSETFAGGFWFYLKLLFERQTKVVVRDSTFAIARIGQCLVIGAIAGSLFSNIRTTDMNTLNGFLFNTMLFSALGSFSILPIVYDQKAVYFKQKDALMFPTWIYCLAQVVSLIPLQIVEGFIYISINYWSAGLASNYNGSRFFAFIVLSIVFGMVQNQVFRLIAMYVPTMGQALPVSGLCFIAMILFSGFIQPKSLISDGWSWFYWLNPVAWALKAVTINELKAPKYDFLTCTTPDCSSEARFGDYVLKQYEISPDERYIWYSFAVLVAEFFFLFICSTLAMKYVRTESAPLPPVRSEDESQVAVADLHNIEEGKAGQIEMITSIPSHQPSAAPSDSSRYSSKGSSRVTKAMLPYEPVSFAFKDIWYTVTLPKGESIDLLQNVNGYFEPGTVTALMGSSGAGKTTLLDVLAGRKNMGVMKGEMYLNGIPKAERYFRKIMGYVEQFDSLSAKATPREAVEFSAALRLASDISKDQREAWVNSVLEMMDLEPIQDELIGSALTGGMSFEQRKRVSIAVELAANPSILFLDEPTTGLDSRAAQNVVKNIRAIAASGRTVVCTIHQPSEVIFESFNHLLLLKKGGQTVFFGSLGDNSRNLVEYFEAIPGVSSLPPRVNPATWMLDVIGAGTANITLTGNETDYHAHYNASTLHQINMDHLHTLMTPNEGSSKILEEEKNLASTASAYNASYWTQFCLLYRRLATTYWRTPTYSLIRNATMIFIALVFASAYPRQSYHTYVAALSRAAVIYITAFFCGILAMILATPVMLEERPVFYREQQSRMYSVFVYVLSFVLLEFPYLLVSSLSFTLPFFYIVGFDNVGAKIAKFFWFWLFNFLVQAVFLCFGVFYVALAPNEATTHVLGGLTNSLMGLFCGFLISEQNYPPFWTFMYWLNPLHYVLEGSIMTMFHGDMTMIRLMDNSDATAETYITQYAFTTWKYGNVGYDILALGLFCFATLTATYLCLSYLRHDKR
jgi:ABC-type multidrug transport system ATPase subunit/ABC-type multidrug transport system permease subunit